MAIVPLLKIDHNLKEPRKNLIVLWSISRCKINYFSYFIPLEFFVVMGKGSQIKQKGDGTIRHCGIRQDLSAFGIVWLQLSVTPQTLSWISSYVVEGTSKLKSMTALLAFYNTITWFLERCRVRFSTIEEKNVSCICKQPFT